MLGKNKKININKHEVDIGTLKKQNVIDLLSIKDLYRKIEEIQKKIEQIKYIDSTLSRMLKKDYENLKKQILDENIQVELNNKIEETKTELNEVSSQMDNKTNKTDFDEEIKFNAYFMGINVENEDNTDALESALLIGNKTIFIPYADKEYYFRRDISIPTGTRIYSNGARIKGGFLINEVDDVIIDGFVFTNRQEGYNEVGVKVINSNNVTIKNCTFDSKIFYAHSEGCKNLKILNNSFKGEYINTSEINVIQIEGYENVIISENVMNCNSPVRFFKLTSGGNDGNNPAIVTISTKNINIINNIIKGTCSKQVIDCYSGVNGFIFKCNQIEVYNCSSIIEGKCDGANEGGSTITSYTSKQNKIIITDNVIISNPSNYIVMFQGGYGLDFEDEYQRINISNNSFENILNANTNIIDIRGFHNVIVSKNLLNKIDRTGSSDYSTSITVGSCKNISIIGNSITNGCIKISEILKTTTGLSYSKSIESINVSNNIIDNICNLGGIYIEGLTNTYNSCYLVSNNIINSLRYQDPQGYAIYLSDNNTFSKITFLGNITKFPNNSAREKIRTGISTSTIISKNNTWEDSI